MNQEVGLGVRGLGLTLRMHRVGQNHIYTVCTVFLAGKSPNIRSYTVYIYGSGQPYTCMTTSLVSGYTAVHTLLIRMYTAYTNN